jgi:hypothetical protein
MSEANPEDDFKVGYKSPPRHSRFRRGQSGNPRGRQRGLRNFGTDVKATLAGPVAVNEQGKAKRVSSQEGMLLRLREKALKGDARALDQFIRLAQAFNNDGPNDALGGQEMLAEDREILDAYTDALRSRPSSDVGADRGPGESSGSDAEEYLPEFDDPSPTGRVPETDSEPKRER